MGGFGVRAPGLWKTLQAAALPCFSVARSVNDLAYLREAMDLGLKLDLGFGKLVRRPRHCKSLTSMQQSRMVFVKTSQPPPSLPALNPKPRALKLTLQETVQCGHLRRKQHLYPRKPSEIVWCSDFLVLGKGLGFADEGRIRGDTMIGGYSPCPRSTYQVEYLSREVVINDLYSEKQGSLRKILNLKPYNRCRGPSVWDIRVCRLLLWVSTLRVAW